MAEYVASLVRGRLAYATIRRRLAGITFGFDVVGRHRAPTHSELVRRTLKGAARTLGTTQRRAEPLTLAELRRIVIGLPIVRGNVNLTAAGRDRVLPALGGLGRCVEPGSSPKVDATASPTT